MKTLTLTIASITMLAAPAFAQTTSMQWTDRTGVMIEEREPAVRAGGKYLGQDPDPFIRLDLLRHGRNAGSGG